MSKEIKNGFMINNGGKAEPLPDDLFDTPNKEREKEIIRLIAEELKNEINRQINQKSDSNINQRFNKDE
jgi:hypothetical protein